MLWDLLVCLDGVPRGSGVFQIDFGLFFLHFALLCSAGI